MSEETEAVECVACQLQLPVINDVLLTQPETVDEHAGRVEFASESDDPLKLSRENSHVFEEFFFLLLSVKTVAAQVVNVCFFPPSFVVHFLF